MSVYTGRPSSAPHRVAVCDFSEGYIRCECGADATVTADPVYDRDEAVAAAWAQHRREAGAFRSKFRGDNRYVLEAL